MVEATVKLIAGPKPAKAEIENALHETVSFFARLNEGLEAAVSDRKSLVVRLSTASRLTGIEGL